MKRPRVSRAPCTEMELLNLNNHSLAINAAVFTAAAAVVRLAGTRLSAYADLIAKKTGMDSVAIGMLLLGGITGLPEGALEQEQRNAVDKRNAQKQDNQQMQAERQPLKTIGIKTATAALLILFAGFLLSRTGDATYALSAAVNAYDYV